MKKLILPLILAFSMPLWGQAGDPSVDNGGYVNTAANPTVVQSASCDTASATCNATFGVAVTAGNYLFCYAAGSGNSTGVSCTMTGETITRLTGASGCSNGTGYEGDCYLATNAVGGQTVITCTMSAGSGGRCMFAEISSPSAGRAKDAGGNARSTTTAISVSTSAGTTNAGDICLGVAYSAFTGGFTALSWTSVINTSTSAGSLLMESTLPGGTGVQTATATAPAGATNEPEGVVCLKP